jgi:hypothetical protein
LFSSFLAFIYKSFYNNKYKNNKLYILSKESKSLLVELKHLASLQLEKATSNNLDLKKAFDTTTKAYNKKLNNFKLNFFLEEDEEEDENEEEGYNTSSSSNSNSNSSSNSRIIKGNSSSSSSTTTTNNSKSSSSTSSSSSDSNSNSNSVTVLERIQIIGKSKDRLSNTIKQKLSSLFINLFQQ